MHHLPISKYIHHISAQNTDLEAGLSTCIIFQSQNIYLTFLLKIRIWRLVYPHASSSNLKIYTSHFRSKYGFVGWFIHMHHLPISKYIPHISAQNTDLEASLSTCIIFQSQNIYITFPLKIRIWRLVYPHASSSNLKIYTSHFCSKYGFGGLFIHMHHLPISKYIPHISAQNTDLEAGLSTCIIFQSQNIYLTFPLKVRIWRLVYPHASSSNLKIYTSHFRSKYTFGGWFIHMHHLPISKYIPD